MPLGHAMSLRLLGTRGAAARFQAESDLSGRVATLVPPVPCSRHGCMARDGQDCAFVDRRGAACRTAWCSEHSESVAGVVYCLRHAGLVRAVMDSDQPMPDGNCRAPSLASWIARELEDDVALFLCSLTSTDAHLRMLSERLRLVYEGYDRTRVWVRSWKLAACNGVAYRVDVCVAEDNDAEVVIRVNLAEVSRTVPPWIAFRMRGMSVDPDRDRALRRRYHEDLLCTIRTGLEQAKPLV